MTEGARQRDPISLLRRIRGRVRLFVPLVVFGSATLLLAVAPYVHGLGTVPLLGPMSWLGLALYAAVTLGCFLAAWAPARDTRTPVALLVAVTLSCAVLLLGGAGYAKCSGSQAAGWSALFRTLDLFVGTADDPFGADASCPPVMPLSIQAARVMALGLTLGTALAAVLRLFVTQRDRVRARWAKRIVLVTGGGAHIAPAVRAINADLPRGVQIVVMGNAREEDGRLRRQGFLVLPDDPSISGTLRDVLRNATRLRAAYLLDDSPQANVATAYELGNIIRDSGDAAGRAVIRVIVRLDDHWRAEQWRREHVGYSDRVVYDTIGLEQVAAQAIVDVALNRGADGVLILGCTPFALALLDELAQHAREHRALGQAPMMPVVVVGEEAGLLTADHQKRQEWFGNATPLDVRSVEAEPGVEVVQRAAELYRSPLVVDCRRPSDATLHLAHRIRTHLTRAFVLTPGAETLGIGEPLIEGIAEYGPSLLAPWGFPEDGWMRLSRHLHETFLLRYPSTEPKPSARPWDELDDFYRGSNVRAITHTMQLVSQVGRTWNPSDRSQAVAPLSEEEINRLAPLEHASWVDYHVSRGWKYGPVRNDRARPPLHDALLPWDRLDLMAREKVRGTLRDALTLLGALGYRPFALPAPKLEPQGGRYRRSGTVKAQKLDRSTTWTTHGGREMTAQAGDWLLRSPGRDPWTITESALLATYAHDHDDVWRRTGSVSARPARRGEHVHTSEGEDVASEGDWVVTDDGGHCWVVPGREFAKVYTPVSDRMPPHDETTGLVDAESANR